MKSTSEKKSFIAAVYGWFARKMKASKKWELKMKKKEPLQCWIVNIMSSRNPFY
jgi:hypothetical protein